MLTACGHCWFTGVEKWDKRMRSNVPLVNRDIRPWPEERAERPILESALRTKEPRRGVPFSMKVIVGPLAKSGLESRVGPDLPAGINAALVFYVGKLHSGRGPVRFPRFLPAPEDPRAAVEVEVDERIEAAICADAERQEVSPAELAGHAILAYLAELDLVGEPRAPG
jgi:hypothetical protein